MKPTENRSLFFLLASAIVLFPSTAGASDFRGIAYFFLLVYVGGALLQVAGLVVFTRRRRKTSTPRALATGTLIPIFPWLLCLLEPIYDLAGGDWYPDIFLSFLTPIGINLSIAIVLQGIALLLGRNLPRPDPPATPPPPATLALLRFLWKLGKRSVATKRRKVITLSTVITTALLLLLVWESPKHFASLSFSRPRIYEDSTKEADGKYITVPGSFSADIRIWNRGSTTLQQPDSPDNPLVLTIAKGSQITKFHPVTRALHSKTPASVKRHPRMPRRSLVITYSDLAPGGLISTMVYYKTNKGRGGFTLAGGDNPINLDRQKTAIVERNMETRDSIVDRLIFVIAATLLTTLAWDLLALIFTTIARPATRSSG